MPKDLPGFYFDKEKNRYFPFRGPIPGASRSSSSVTTLKTIPDVKKSRGVGLKPAQLLQDRELYGNVITSGRGRCNFQEEYLKIQSSQPEVWKYHLTRGCDVALEQLHVNVQTQDGLIDTDILLGGSADGTLSVFKALKVKELPDFGRLCMGVCVWPPQKAKQREPIKVPGHLWTRSHTSINVGCDMSCMKVSKRHSDGLPSPHHAIVTYLGSEASGGSLYTLDLRDPFCFGPYVDALRTRWRKVTSFNCTVWSADSSSSESQAAVGTNLGAALVNLEAGVPSWVLRCKSDVLSVRFDQSGKNVLCGLRNGAIVTIDTRQKSDGISRRLSKHDIPFPSHGSSKPSYRTAQSSSNRRFEFKGDISKSEIIFMPSSISCLESLRLYDQYFLASSMDGSIRLYDQRLIQRGPVQSYEGHVNSHTRIGFGIDPYERNVMSGGEDLNLRLWSIKSGQLLYENKFMDYIPSVVCWPKGSFDNLNQGSGAWVASREGIYHMRWP